MGAPLGRLTAGSSWRAGPGSVAEPPGYDVRGAGVGMRAAGGGPEDVNDFEPEPAQDVGDQSAVATPPDRFSAHDRRTHAERQIDQDHKSVRKRAGGHVIGVSPE